MPLWLVGSPNTCTAWEIYSLNKKRLQASSVSLSERVVLLSLCLSLLWGVASCTLATANSQNAGQETSVSTRAHGSALAIRGMPFQKNVCDPPREPGNNRDVPHSSGTSR